MIRFKDESCMVTIFCTSFNHGKYIRETLDSIINQKTQYKFKIVVHDDASVDDSQQIIAEYVERFPDVIIPILQKENQFSKGINVYNEHIESVMRGKYIAYCECDDFWTDEYKLQKQIDYMEAHPECSMCVHNTKKVDEQGNELNSFFNDLGIDMDYDANDIILAGGGGLFHTSSYLYRTDLKVIMPSCFAMKKVADYPMAIYLSTKGYVHYIGEVMSAYRVAAVQSWSTIFNANNKARVAHYLELIDSLQAMDEYTNHVYTESFQKKIEEIEYLYLFQTYQLGKILSNTGYKKKFNENSLMVRLKYLIKSCLMKIKKSE